MKTLSKIAVGMCVIGLSTTAMADASLEFNASTLGFGGQYAHGLSDKWDVTAGFNTFSYDYNTTENHVDYKAELDLNTIALGGRYKPWAGSFFLSAALVVNNNEINLNAQPQNFQFTFNGHTYSTADIGSLALKADFPKIRPMLGLGWQANLFGTGVTLTPQLGVLFSGKPEISRQLTCNVPNSTICQRAEQDIDVEINKVSDALDNFNIYPNLSLGIGYKF